MLGMVNQATPKHTSISFDEKIEKIETMAKVAYAKNRAENAATNNRASVSRETSSSDNIAVIAFVGRESWNAEYLLSQGAGKPLFLVSVATCGWSLTT
jgi:hypothetical protein